MCVAWTEPYPIAELSSSLVPSASKMTSSLGSRWPANVLDTPVSNVSRICTHTWQAA